MKPIPTLTDAVSPDLFTAPYQPHSATSKAAAAGIEPKAGTLRALVLNWLRARGSYGATDEEIAYQYDLNPSTARPRRVELVQAGLVRDSGQTRPTRSGRQATVWVAV